MKRRYYLIASVLLTSSILSACSSVSAQSSRGPIKSAKTIDSVYKTKEIVDFNKAKTNQSVKKKQAKSETLQSSSVNKEEEEIKKTEMAATAATKKEEAVVTDTRSDATNQTQPQTSQVLNTAIVYQGKVLHYGPNFGPLESSNGAAYQAQAYIDSSPWSNIALGWNDVNFNDGVGTYMAGHNQGVFTPLTSLDYGSTVDVYDRSGNKKTYVVKEHAHLWNDTGQPITVNDEADRIIEKMKVTESIVIQYCLEDDMQLYYLTPVD